MNTQNLDTKELIDTSKLDQELINFVAEPFTTSTYNFILISGSFSHRIEIRREETVIKVLSLINRLEKSYPPEQDTDISGIEEIYE